MPAQPEDQLRILTDGFMIRKQPLRSQCIALLLVLSFIVVCPLKAEDDGACMLQGTVRDPGGLLVPGARVLLEPAVEGPKRWRGGRGRPAEEWVLTDEKGSYCFSDIDPGVYAIRVTAEGFEEKRLTSIMVGTGEKNVIDIVLSLITKEEVITVTATATRTEKLIENIPIRTEIIPADVIKLSASRTLGDAVEFTTGIRTESNCQNCNFTQIRLLGLMGDYTQILFDGQPTMSSVAMVYGIEQIPAAMIDRIEVVKGGGSALYGPGSVAGVINIMSLRPSKSGGYFESRYESMDGQPNFSLGAGANWVSANRATAFTVYGQADRVKPLDVTEDGFTEVAKRNFEAFGSRLDQQLLGSKARLTFDFNHVRENRRGGDRLDLPEYMANTAESVRSRRNASGLSWYHSVSRKFDYRFTVSFAGQHRSSYYGSGMDPNAYGNTDNPLWVIDSQFNHYWHSHVLSWGSQLSHEQLQDRQPAYSRIVDDTYTDVGFYVQDDWFFAHGWELVYGARLDKHTKIDAVIASPRAALMWSPRKDFRFRGSVATGFQAPRVFDEDLHITQIGGEGRVIRNSKNLRQESSITCTLGTEWRPRLGSSSAMIDFNLFYTGIRNLFNVHEDDDPTTPDLEFVRTNSGTAKVYGMELNLGYGIPKKFRVEAGYVEQRSRFGQPEPDFKSKDFFRTPNRYGTLTATWKHPGLVDVFLGAKFTGPMKAPHYAGFIEEDRLETTPSFITLDASVSRSFDVGGDSKTIFSVGVKNLTNSYQKDLDQGPKRDAGYVYGPRFPRSAYASIRLEF
jgi:outer membrane receptor for ferrienterochelin and colicins